jgi:hypothetical protein
MAVYKKTYRPYEGELTPGWSRFLVIPRYAFEELHGKRFLTIFFLASFIYPLICALIIYVQHNASALSLLGVQQGARGLISINVTFFHVAARLAEHDGAVPGGVHRARAGVARSGQQRPLAVPGAPLFARGIRARQDVRAGDSDVADDLGAGAALFGLQGYLEGWQWMRDNARLASGMFFGAWVWILLLALLALALSAWVKWKPAAGGLMFGVFFVGSAFGAVINAVQRTNWGNLFNVSHLVGVVWVQLFEGSNQTTNGAVFFRAPQDETCRCGLAGPRWRAGADLPVHAGAQDSRRGGGAMSAQAAKP